MAPKSELLRIVAAESAATPEVQARRAKTVALADPHALMPGRGAYLCREVDAPRPVERCLTPALQRGAIARALRRAIPGGLVLNDAELVESVGR